VPKRFDACGSMTTKNLNSPEAKSGIFIKTLLEHSWP